MMDHWLCVVLGGTMGMVATETQTLRGLKGVELPGQGPVPVHRADLRVARLAVVVATKTMGGVVMATRMPLVP